MRRTIIAALTLLLIAACGSSGSTTTIMSKTAAPPRTASSKLALPGVATGRHGDLHTLSELPRVRHASIAAHINGVAGETLPEKLNTFANAVATLWQLEFTHLPATTQLAPATAQIVDQPPVTCGASQVTTEDPPEYCAADGSIELPLAFLNAHIAPLGDGALLLVVANLYGYHVENTLGLLHSAALTAAQLEEIDSCLSGVYFAYADYEKQLQPADESSVDALLAVEAPTSATAPGDVSAGELASAFNKGIIGAGDYRVCVPAGAS